MMLYKAGSVVRTSDGREGTIVFNGLTGQGIVWGRIILPKPNDLVRGGSGAIGLGDDIPASEFNWPEPEAMLRHKNLTNRLGIECVGENVTLVAVPDADVMTADSYRLVDHSEGE